MYVYMYIIYVWMYIVYGRARADATTTTWQLVLQQGVSESSDAYYRQCFSNGMDEDNQAHQPCV